MSIAIGRFREIKNRQVFLAREYETSSAYKVAYISLWGVTESAVKDTEGYRLRRDLSKKVALWKNYLDGDIDIKPQAIKSFNTFIDKIPTLSNVENIIGSCPCIFKLLQPQQKKPVSIEISAIQLQCR